MSVDGTEKLQLTRTVTDKFPAQEKQTECSSQWMRHEAEVHPSDTILSTAGPGNKSDFYVKMYACSMARRMLH